MKLSVSNLRPNPFRDLDRYPINQEKVDALAQSIKDTSFWDNLVARKGGDGAYELAYGVHRLRALKKAGIDEIDIPVRQLTDDIMIKMMIHENQVEWASSALIDQESVRAVVLAFAEGRIKLPDVTKGTSRGTIRHAPSFLVNADGGEDLGRPRSSYTAGTLSRYLGGEKAGWPEGKVEAVLRTLATLERNLIERDDLKGLSTHQADEVARQAKRVVQETGNEQLAKSISKRLADGMRSGTGRPPGRGGKTKSSHQAITYHGAKRAADEMMGRHLNMTKERKVEEAGRALPKLAAQIASILYDDSISEKLAFVVPVAAELRESNAKDLKMIVGTLRGVAKRANQFADKLEG